MEPFDSSRFDPDALFYFTVSAANADGTLDIHADPVHAFATEKEATESAMHDFEEYGCETAIYHAIPVKVIRRSPKIIKTAPKGERT